MMIEDDDVKIVKILLAVTVGILRVITKIPIRVIIMMMVMIKNDDNDYDK